MQNTNLLIRKTFLLSVQRTQLDLRLSPDYAKAAAGHVAYDAICRACQIRIKRRRICLGRLDNIYAKPLCQLVDKANSGLIIIKGFDTNVTYDVCKFTASASPPSSTFRLEQRKDRAVCSQDWDSMSRLPAEKLHPEP